MKTSENINELAKAMSLAQSAMKPAIKDSTNPHFKSRYADLTSIWESIRQPFTGNGLTVWQDVTMSEGAVMVTTRITHLSGQYCEFGPFPIIPKDKTAHSFGSAVSYARRYSLSAALGIVSDDDDDANEATFGKQKEPEKEKPAKKKYDGYTGKRIDNEQRDILSNLIREDTPYLNRILDWMVAVGLEPKLESLPLPEYIPILDRVKERMKMKMKEEVGF